MRATRRLSQAISEGDGISLLVPVADLGSARTAEAEGAEGLVLLRPIAGLREATSLPLLWSLAGAAEAARDAEADACVVVVDAFEDDAERLADLHAHVQELGLECVVEVHDDQELERALDELDPEIVLLGGAHADEEEPLERVLDLLPDLPAGKLAIADVAVETREQVVALERAGIDAVIVRTGNIAGLVGGALPEV